MSLWTLQPHGLYSPGNSPGRILEWVAFPSPGDLPNPGIKPSPPALQADSLPAEPQGKPKHIGVGSLSFLQHLFLTQEVNWGLLPCRRILYQLSYQGNVHQFARLTTLCERNFVTLGTALCRNYGFFFFSLYFLAVPLSMPGLSSPSRD